MLAFSASVMTITALVCGMSAALRTSELRPIDTLKTRSGGLDVSVRRYTSILVVSQLALSFVLIVVAGLFVGTFARLMTADLGFDRRGVTLIGVDPDSTGIERTARIALFEQVHEAALSVPGVDGAAISNLTPFGRRRFGVRFQVPGRTGDADGNGYFVSAGWFSTYRMALLAGRDFNAQDRAGAVRTVIVNEAFARSFAEGGNPVGLTIDHVDGKRRVQYQIIGLASDSAYNSIRERASAPLTFYFPLAQYDTTNFPGPGEMTVTVRAADGSGALVARNVAAAIMQVNPQLSLSVRTLSDQVMVSVSQERLLAMLASFFGVLALLLAAVGLYGVTFLRRESPPSGNGNQDRPWRRTSTLGLDGPAAGWRVDFRRCGRGDSAELVGNTVHRRFFVVRTTTARSFDSARVDRRFGDGWSPCRLSSRPPCRSRGSHSGVAIRMNHGMLGVGAEHISHHLELAV